MTSSVLKPIAQSNALHLDRPKFDRTVRDAHAQFLCGKAKTIARGQDVLFHGTRRRERVLESGFLRPSRASQAVAFSRSARVAAHFATLPRDDDEGVGAILVFDRSSLKTRYKLECIDNGWATDASEFNEFWRAMHDEFEEHVFARDVEIAPHLIAMISTPIASLSHKQRAANRAMELRFDHKTPDCSCGARWRSCSDCRAEATKKKAEQLERAYPGISTLWRDGAS
jgi:hypothetical protein